MSKRNPIVPSPMPKAIVLATPAVETILLTKFDPINALIVSGKKLNPDCTAVKCSTSWV
ncbi:hypothetical protein [Brevibacillus brevis]|uniref:hypothetical protein n=1 Tax=Brevibacillus brevis TaxID=1393 RepID=UPI001EE2BD65|nr:hypothetical protein [Brevibacillus brevis]